MCHSIGLHPNYGLHSVDGGARDVGAGEPALEGPIIAREYWSLVPIAVFIVFLGLYPRPLMQMFEFFGGALA